MRPKEIRIAAHVSQIQVAARTGRSLPTIRVYELDPESCTPRTRDALAPVYAEMAARILTSSTTPRTAA